jgi:hypothetical protein
MELFTALDILFFLLSRFSFQIYYFHENLDLCNLKFSEKEAITGTPIQLFILSYYYGKLESMNISFSESNFSGVISALSEKYGAAEPKTGTVHNRVGASFENRTYSWRKERATLEATRYSRDLETSRVSYRTDFAMEEFGRRKKTTDKKKAGDL